MFRLFYIVTDIITNVVFFFHFDSLTLPQKCLLPPWGDLPPTFKRVWIFQHILYHQRCTNRQQQHKCDNCKVYLDT